MVGIVGFPTEDSPASLTLPLRSSSAGTTLPFPAIVLLLSFVSRPVSRGLLSTELPQTPRILVSALQLLHAPFLLLLLSFSFVSVVFPLVLLRPYAPCVSLFLSKFEFEFDSASPWFPPKKALFGRREMGKRLCLAETSNRTPAVDCRFFRREEQPVVEITRTGKIMKI